MVKDILFSVLIIIVVGFPILANAQSPMNMVWSAGECQALGTNAQKLCTILWRIQEVLYVAGIGLGAIMVIVGGIIYATAQDSEEKIRQARKTIINGLIGVAIVFAFAFILGFVRTFVAQNFTS